MPNIYQHIPNEITNACDAVVAAYLSDRMPTVDPGLLSSPAAAVYSEAMALQAVELLTVRTGQANDLVFASLLEFEPFADLAPTMRQLLRFLRARLANHDPVLRLAEQIRPGTQDLALAFLLIAAHALATSGIEPACALPEIRRQLITDPADARTTPGNLSYPDPQSRAAGLTEDLDMLSETVPIRHARPLGDGRMLLILALEARPDVQDLLRMLITDGPADGADTWTKWSALPEAGIVRLSIEWIDPVRIGLALAFSINEHREVLCTIAAGDQLGLAETDPADIGPDQRFGSIWIPANPDSLDYILSYF